MANTLSYQSEFSGIEIDQVIARCRTGNNLRNLELLDSYINKIDSSDKGVTQVKGDITDIKNALSSKFSIYGGEIKEGSDGAGNPKDGQIKKKVDCANYEAAKKALIRFDDAPKKYAPLFSCNISGGDLSMGVQADTYDFIWQFCPHNATADSTDIRQLARITTKGQVYGAVWNDFAEFRQSNEQEAGRVICENGDGTLSRSHKRLQPGAAIISDTYGFAIGETIKNKIPIAVAGRVLAYTYEDWWTFEPGEAVCAGPNGTVSKMSRKEIRKYPERIIGTVSELPSYEYWGDNHIKVNGRIWIKIK